MELRSVFSLEKTNHLYWLGRYTERVFSTVNIFLRYYDKMLDGDDNLYQKYCESIRIPDIYKDKQDFGRRYLFDPENPDSVYVNLRRAYDNAVVLRDEISSQTLSYIELAMTALQKAGDSPTPLLAMQKVIDQLFAFWGCADDFVVDESCRSIMKCGKYVERLDLYISLDYPREKIKHEFEKLDYRLRHTGRPFNDGHYRRFKRAVWREDDLKGELEILNMIFEV